MSRSDKAAAALREQAKRAGEGIVSAARHFFDQNAWLRVISIVVAVVMWVVVVQSNTSDRKMTLTGLEIEIIGRDELENAGLVLAEDLSELLPEKVDVRLFGKKGVMEALNKGSIKVILDLTRIKAEGTRTLSLEVQNADGVTASVIGASSFALTAKERHDSAIPVKIVFTGEAAEGYLADKESFTCEPSRIRLYGSSEDLSRIKSAQVTVDLSGLTSGVESQFSYVLLDENGDETRMHAIEADTQSIIVTGPVYYTMMVDVSLIPSSLENPDYMVNLDKYEYKAELAQTQVMVCGDKNELERYFSEKKEIYLLPALVEETANTVKMQSVQENIAAVKKCVPASVEVRYSVIERIVPVTLALLKIHAENAADDVAVTIDPEYIDAVLFTVPITKADLINRDAIQAYVDLRSYGIGEHTVPVRLREAGGSSGLVDFERDVDFERSVKVTIELFD